MSELLPQWSGLVVSPFWKFPPELWQKPEDWSCWLYLNPQFMLPPIHKMTIPSISSLRKFNLLSVLMAIDHNIGLLSSQSKGQRSETTWKLWIVPCSQGHKIPWTPFLASVCIIRASVWTHGLGKLLSRWGWAHSQSHEPPFCQNRQHTASCTESVLGCHRGHVMVPPPGSYWTASGAPSVLQHGARVRWTL